MGGNNSEVAALISSVGAQGLIFMTTQKMAFWVKLIVHFISKSGNRKCCSGTIHDPVCLQPTPLIFLHSSATGLRMSVSTFLPLSFSIYGPAALEFVWFCLF